MLKKENIFRYLQIHPEYRFGIYGAGKKGVTKSFLFDRVDFFCDKRADEIVEVRGISCIKPQEIVKIEGKKVVLLCIKKREYRKEAIETLHEIDPEIEIFDLYNNSAFSCFEGDEYKYDFCKKDQIKINIVCEDEGWIFTKFAEKLQEGVIAEGLLAEVSDKEDPSADVNHYIGYHILTDIFNDSSTIRTTMITHVDTNEKKELIQYQARNKVMGICMSADTMSKLANWGIPRNRICYINPAHDNSIKPRKIVLGITYRCHGKEDFRKRDDSIVEICKKLDSKYFLIKIMGDGWDDIVIDLRNMGFEVEYHPMFEREVYKQLMPSLDYWIYYGFDEGSMGYLDALAAGVKTIATPQGYHLDTKYGLTYTCSTIGDFIDVLIEIQKEKERIVTSVADWTWSNYAKKHIEIWKYLLACAPLSDLLKHQGEYQDGIFSVFLEDNKV